MLAIPAGSSSLAAIIGIDPGSNTLGVSILQFDVVTLAIVSTRAFTLVGQKEAKGSWTSEIHGDRHGRIETHRANLLQIFQYEQPFEVVSESPFFNRLQPSAYGPLVETISAVRQAVMQYDTWKQLYLIDPPTVKNAVGVKGNKGGKEGKEMMKVAVLALSSILNFQGPVPLHLLDEHSIDALAVAYARYRKLLEELCLV